MKKITNLLIGFLLISSGAFAQISQEQYQQAKIEGLQSPEDAFNFLVVGDWGRNGHFGQQPVADRMDETAYHLGIEFIVTTGDNFYENGVASIHDPMWQTSYEQVYHGGNLFCNWFAVLGNHDYRGNPQAQLDYSAISQRWNMPDRYYSFERELEDESGEKALFVFIDSNPFEKKYYEEETYKYTQIVQQDTAKQMRWLKQTLATSEAKWKIVIGHHPLYSTGKRLGKTQDHVDAFEPIFEQYQVDAYFAGHEHDLQHQKLPKKYTHHFISGAGSEIRPTGKQDYTLFAESEHGFMAVSILAKELLVQAISKEGKVIYSTAIKK